MAADDPRIAVFHDDNEGVDKIGLCIEHASIVQIGEDLLPGATMTPWQGRCLAHALVELADRIEGNGEAAAA